MLFRTWSFRWSVSASVCAIAMFATGFAQAPQTPPAPAAQAPAAAQAAPANRLPVRRVVLYKSGVGYFEHLGKVRGNQTVSIEFTSGQLDDVLKSLTTLDLDGGRVLGVTYNSEASLDRRLAALQLPVGEDTTRAAFLSALRGARLDVHSATSRVTGRLLSVEQSADRQGTTAIPVDMLSVVTDAGEIQTIALTPGVTVRIVDSDLAQQVGRYLSLVASARNQDVRRLAISTTGTGERDLFVSYISEVPVWKATYRIVLPTAGDARKPLLQGWAIVDNTVGEDWENVQLSLVAGAPQSFIEAISRPYYVQRPVVPLPDRVLLSPQTHQAGLGNGSPGVLAGSVSDQSGGVLPGVMVQVTANGDVVATAATDTTGRYRVENVPGGVYELRFALGGFKTVVRQGVEVSGGMESVMNVTMQIGAVTEEVAVTAGAPVVDAKRTTTGVAGSGGGGRGGAPMNAPRAMNPAAPPPPPAVDMFRAGSQTAADAAQLGDLFEYMLKEPVTIRKDQSALVPILSSDVDAEKVSLWNANANSPRPLRALWLTNATGLTLDGGSFSVVEGQAFAGEGLMDPLKPGEKRLLSFAADLGVQVDAKGESLPSKTTKVSISQGLVIQQTEERQRRTYTARNEDTEPRVLVIEHPVRVGWTVGGSLAPTETTAAWHRFRVNIAPKTTSTFVVEEVRQGQTQYSINSITDVQVALLVRDELISPALQASLKQVVAQKAEIARLSNELATRQNEIAAIGRDQDRVRENMKSLKGSAEERQLVQRYVKQLDDQENRLEVLRKESDQLTADRTKAQAELARLIDSLSG
jgi:hypothetical protein